MDVLKALFHCVLGCGVATEKFGTVRIPQFLAVICVQFTNLLSPSWRFIEFSLRFHNTEVS